MNQSRTENIDRRVLADLLATSSVAVKCLVHCRHSTFGHPAVCCFPGGTLAFGGTLDKITITTFQCAGHNHGFLHIFKEKCMSMITFKVIKCFIFTLEVFYFEMITFYICSYLILMPFLKLCAQKLHLTFTEGITQTMKGRKISFQIQVWRYLKNTKNILKVEGAILRQKKKSLKLGTMSSWTIKSRMKPEEHTMLVLKKDKVPMDSFMPAASTPSSPAGTLTGKIGRIDEFC